MDDFFSTPAEEDPTASFLAREQAALGVEAAADFNASSSTPHNGSHFPDLDTHDSTPGAGPELGLGGDGFMDGFGQAPVLQQAQVSELGTWDETDADVVEWIWDHYARAVWASTVPHERCAPRSRLQHLCIHFQRAREFCPSVRGPPSSKLEMMRLMDRFV